jgi:CCR4-NOT transcription complex subunit 3
LRLQQQQQLQAQQAAALRQQQEAQARQHQQQQQQQEAALRQRQQLEAAAKQKALQEQQAQQHAAALRQQQEAALRQQQPQQQQQAVLQQHQHQQQLQAVQEALAPGTPGNVPGGAAVGGGSGLDIISGLNGLNLGGLPSVGDMVPGGLGPPAGKSLSGDVGTIAGVSPSSGNVGYNMSSAATNNNSSMLQESFATLPSANEQDRVRPYTPQNPYPATPGSYPSAPSTLFENPAIFEKLGTNALFFIFYYQQGTYQQYLAARELKKQSWRFHKKYMTWFQRHEEPKLTTDEYEQGTYVYFDYETGWCTRIKQDFRFEYSFLEDSLQ